MEYNTSDPSLSNAGVPHDGSLYEQANPRQIEYQMYHHGYMPTPTYPTSQQQPQQAHQHLQHHHPQQQQHFDVSLSQQYNRPDIYSDAPQLQNPQIPAHLFHANQPLSQLPQLSPPILSHAQQQLVQQETINVPLTDGSEQHQDASLAGSKRPRQTPFRQRISRACDTCNITRTKCNGEQPCSRCLSMKIDCQYEREVKKRGKAPRKDPSSSTPIKSATAATTATSSSSKVTAKARPAKPSHTQSQDSFTSGSTLHQAAAAQHQWLQSSTTPSRGSLSAASQDIPASSPIYPPDQFAKDDNAQLIMLNISQSSNPSFQQQQTTSPASNLFQPFSAAADARRSISNNPVKYPVLTPIFPYVDPFLPRNVTCDLFEGYFQTTSSVYPQPASPYLLAFLLRRSSILNVVSCRARSPALLASMLWVSAMTTELPFFHTSPQIRANVCAQLRQITLKLLLPFQKLETPLKTNLDVKNDNMTDVLKQGNFLHYEDKWVVASLDDVISYVHIATLVSAGESKSASIRWWQVAWALAKEMKLGQEVLADADTLAKDFESLGTHPDVESSTNYVATFLTEEEREERRRCWWLLYIMDRHLSLCYNKPLALLDRECQGLQQPVDDLKWINGVFWHNDPSGGRRTGPPTTFSGSGLFGFFLPLMTIQGHILNKQEFHLCPFIDSSAKTFILGSLTQQIQGELHTFFNSAQPGPDDRSSDYNSLPREAPQREFIRQHVLARKYSSFLAQILFILSAGNWDPATLLTNQNLYSSSPEFADSLSHAISATNLLAEILDHDSQLLFMPFLTGIYLFQGCLPLLLAAERIAQRGMEPEEPDAEGDADGEIDDAVVLSPAQDASVLRACETVVRAHESCVATLQTEYQRNLRKVLHSVLSQAKGQGIQGSPEEQAKSRRDLLSWYKWTSEGKGLAV